MNSRLLKISYTMKHWLAYQKTGVKLGLWKPRHLLHDLDKVIMLCLGVEVKKASRLHRSWSSHHEDKNGVITVVVDAVIDWECARLTKPDKPMNAVETAEKYYPKYAKETKHIMDNSKLAH